MNEDTRTKSNGRPMSVLVVDDEEPFRLLIERRLASSRHHVECVANGEAALDRLSDRTFDVVLLDLRMPGIGDYRAAGAAGPQVLVVVGGGEDGLGTDAFPKVKVAARGRDGPSPPGVVGGERLLLVERTLPSEVVGVADVERSAFG